MRESFRSLRRQTQVFTVILSLAYVAVATFGIGSCRFEVVVGLAVIFAATGLVQPLPYSSGGQVFPTNSVKIVAALLWRPDEVLIGVGVGSFLGLLLFRRSEVWRAESNGVGWGLASGAAALVAQQASQRLQTGGLLPLIVAAFLAVATNRLVNEAIFSVYRAQRFRRSFLPEWLHSIADQWFSQILAAPMAIVLAAVAGRIGTTWSALALTVVSAIALPIPRQELAYYHRAQQMLDEIVEAMVRALEGVDPNTRAHGNRVSELAVETGRQFGMSERALVALRLASRLHDVGLLAGSREGGEKEHNAVVGARILGRFPDPLIAEFVRAHNERWDGKGTPDHLKANAIPLGARILTVAEAYDSFLAGFGPPDAPQSRHAAASHVISLAGTAFDPTVVMAVLRVAAEQNTTLRAAG